MGDIPAPTPEDLVRVPADDLRLYDDLDSLYTEDDDGRTVHKHRSEIGQDEARLADLAREALPAWIRRAVAAEARLAELDRDNHRLRLLCMKPVEGGLCPEDAGVFFKAEPLEGLCLAHAGELEGGLHG